MTDKALQAIQDVVRLPLYQEESWNRFTDNDRYYGQRIQNFIPEYVIDPANQTKVSILTKRQGLASTNLDWSSLVNDPLRCTVLDFICITAVFDVFVAAIFDASNATIYILQLRPKTGSVTKIGSFTSTVANTANDYCFLSEYTQSSGGSSYPAVAVSWTASALTLSKGYYATTSSGVFSAASLTEITDTSFPPKQTPALISVGRFIWMNGTIYIATLDGRIWNSASTNNDIATWHDTNNQIGFTSANTYPDQCLGLARYKNHIVAFGRDSIEFFTDVGNNPCPIAKTEQAFIKFGAYNARLFRSVGDELYWIAYGSAGTRGIWKLEGYTPVKISSTMIDSAIDSSLSGGVETGTINLQATVVNNKRHLILNNIVLYTILYGNSDTFNVADTYPPQSIHDFSSAVMMYNIEDNTWWQWTSIDRNTFLFSATEFNTLSGTNTGAYDQYILLSNNTTISLGQWFVFKWRTDGNYYDDVPYSGSSYYPTQPYMTIVQTNPNWFTNEKRKRISKLKIICYPQNISTTDVYSMYLAYVRNADQGSSPITHQLRSLIIPTTSFRYYFNNLGMGRVWSFLICEKSKLPLKLAYIELDIQQGSH